MTRRQNINPIHFGDLGTIEPVSRVFGFDRGQVIDRYFIEQFLDANSCHIRGRVLEVEDNAYTRRFGKEQVNKSDVLHLRGGSARVTIVGDLSDPEFPVPDATFDCIVLTQTLQFIFAMSAAVTTLHRILRPGGCLLVTVPGISQISRHDMDRWGDCWRFTDYSLARLLGGIFPKDKVRVQTFGNVLTSQCFLQGMVVEDLPEGALAVVDPDYQMLVAACAIKDA